MKFKLINEAKKKADIKVENPGVLEVPEGKKVYDLPVSHFKKLIDKKGREKVIRAITNLEVWNKNDDPKISSWAKKMKKSLEGYGEKKEESLKEGFKYQDPTRIREFLDSLPTSKLGRIYYEYNTRNNDELSYIIDDEDLDKLGYKEKPMREDRKIDIYKDKEYQYSTNRFKRVKDAVADAKSGKDIEIAGIPSRKVKYADTDKITGRFAREGLNENKEDNRETIVKKVTDKLSNDSSYDDIKIAVKNTMEEISRGYSKDERAYKKLLDDTLVKLKNPDRPLSSYITPLNKKEGLKEEKGTFFTKGNPAYLVMAYPDGKVLGVFATKGSAKDFSRYYETQRPEERTAVLITAYYNI